MQPKISCICITHQKDESLQRAINCFLAQTYANKELFILYESEDEIAKTVLDKYQTTPSISIICVPSVPKLSLGALRNIAIGKSNGEYFCQWDDDDWYSSNRLEKQMSMIGQHNGLLLDQWFIFDRSTAQAYLSNKRIWEGSLLCDKTFKKEGDFYPPIAKGEDTDLIDQLTASASLATMSAPYLYIYVYDGKNTWDKSHWNAIFNASTPLTKWLSKDIEYILDQKYDAFEASYRLEQLYHSLT